MAKRRKPSSPPRDTPPDPAHIANYVGRFYPIPTPVDVSYNEDGSWTVHYSASPITLSDEWFTSHFAPVTPVTSSLVADLESFTPHSFDPNDEAGIDCYG